jgi:hypothetical protein
MSDLMKTSLNELSAEINIIKSNLKQLKSKFGVESKQPFMEKINKGKEKAKEKV